MIRIKLMDGGTLEIPREEALELLPYRGVFVSPLFKNPVEGVCTYRGKLLPVLGPLPADPTDHLPGEERAWILVMKGCAQAIQGFPDFNEAAPALGSSPENAAGNDGLLQELDQLLKAA